MAQIVALIVLAATFPHQTALSVSPVSLDTLRGLDHGSAMRARLVAGQLLAQPLVTRVPVAKCLS